ncbi:hypothetical protein AB0L75_08165 [Streptomyces sp. NPDC052101]|uniref:hypothetical protein n=1 Tax=Streptomyces sp. NPDC052101 TaxID=3155763 RepID=UPI003432361E
MRIRATVAAVSGALALSAFVMPAARAADAGSASFRADAARTVSHAASGKAAFSTAEAATRLNVTFSHLKIAKAVKVGTTNHVSTSVSYTLTHGAGVDFTSHDFATGPFIYTGSSSAPDKLLFGDNPATCTATSATTASCKGLIDIYPGPGSEQLVNADAGTWHAGALALVYSAKASAAQFDLGATLVQRNSTLTVDAAPEPVKKGATVTVTGKLARADWEDHKYHGYTGRPVKLQFRPKGSSTYTTLKTITSDSAGNLRTTVKATVDGYYRYSFAGTSTTPAVNATGDFVDVQ